MMSFFGRGRLRLQALGLVPVLVALSLALTAPAVADPHEQIAENEAKKQRAQAAAARLSRKASRLALVVNEADRRVARVQAEVDELDDRIAKLNERIGVVERRLTNTQIRLSFLSQELEQIEERLQERTDLFTGRAVAAYMAGPNAYLEGLVSSTSFTELTSRLAYYEAALDTDSKLVEEIDSLRAETDARRVEVEEKEREIAEHRLVLESKKAQVTEIRVQRSSALAARRALLREKVSLLNAVESEKQRYQQIVGELEADSARLRAILAARAAGFSGVVPTGNGQLLWPANGPMTSGYGYRTHPIFGDRRLHTGIDISAPYGSTVFAADAGVVAYVGVMSGYGNVVVVDHGGGLATTYNHLSAYAVGTGQTVARGMPVGAVGCTGYCTGPHLHFEVRINGSPVDPLPYLQ